MRLDVNSMKPLDNLCHPVSVIADAEQLAAEAFGAAHAFLMVGGTTSAVQSMVLTAVKRGEKFFCDVFWRALFSEAIPRSRGQGCYVLPCTCQQPCWHDAMSHVHWWVCE